MTIDDGLRFRTSISEMDDEEIFVRGYPLSELIRTRRYAESTYLTLRGELPGPARRPLPARGPAGTGDRPPSAHSAPVGHGQKSGG